MLLNNNKFFVIFKTGCYNLHEKGCVVVIAERVKSLRESLGLSGTTLAELSGVSQPYISMLQCRRIQRPHFHSLFSFAATSKGCVVNV